MATLVLAAAGSALGGAVGGSVAGLSSLVAGKALGATLGSVVDQQLMGLGADPVESGRTDRFRIMGSSEGAALPRVFGRMRVAGQIIWSSNFLEDVNSRSAGGKGGGQKVDEFSYSVSLAVALCEGEVIRIGRIWADGQAVDQSTLNWRLHTGSEDQLPDPLIAAIEGDGAAPAYRGTAYVVIENLELSSYGNRIPQFNFEVFRRPKSETVPLPRSPALDIRGVALVPGTGEYSLATEPVHFEREKGSTELLNVHNDLGMPDLNTSIRQLSADLPNCKSAALVVTWFGDDLRCNHCTLRPKVEQNVQDGTPMRWQVSGVSRQAAQEVSRLDGRPIFGGTPTDASVIQAIRHMKESGQRVMFYPFILMDILAGNGRRDPWSDANNQPKVPWRGRITLSRAPDQPGSTDKSAAAADEVGAFFGVAGAADFHISGSTVVYSGPEEWSYRRFILHYAHLCALAGGVDAFCIGSEMRGLTQIRDGADSYPAVRALRALAADVRSIVGSGTRIGYAADWSEYFGHQPSDGSGDALFHLDPLWAHPAIDFIGIDNYMPLSDWRDGLEHLDAKSGSIYSLDYLSGNVAGGEGYDWYYADQAARDGQVRTPIRDGAYGDDWVFRYKDLVNWWSKPHTNRIGGIKATSNTSWQPRSKPIWFTELGCPAVDKGTNQPNVFFDPKSSESFFPYYSKGMRDDFIQYRYLQAMYSHWNDPAHNPVSDIYGGRMVDMDRAHVWAWDARPWPDFPNRLETWIDGDNYARGHWLNGRLTAPALAEVIAEICERAGLSDLDLAHLHGGVTGYLVSDVESSRQSLQPLMLAYAVDSFAIDGNVAFSSRNGRISAEVSREACATRNGEPVLSLTRGPSAESAGRVVVGFVRSDMDYLAGATEALAPQATEPHTAQSALPIVLSEGQAKAIADRWLGEGWIARDTIAFSLPPSDLAITPGDIVSISDSARSDLYRVDRVEEIGYRAISAVRVELGIYDAPVYAEYPLRSQMLTLPTRAHVEFLDLPLLKGDEKPHAPYVAATNRPWLGPIAVYSASEDAGYSLVGKVQRPSIFGETLDTLPAGVPGLWMRGAVRVRIGSGSLQSRSEADVANGANVAALRFGGADWEVIQFARADLIAPKTYRLSELLRGQAGTDGVMPDSWPVGTSFVLLDGSAVQLDLQSSNRGLERHYRAGPATRSYEDASYSHSVHAFEGVGLRPYRPAHLAARGGADGNIALTWKRRTRIDGDSWKGTDVPLGEEREVYHVRVTSGANTLREFQIAHPNWTYTSSAQLSDEAGLPLTFEVAQVSDRFGPGPYARIVFHG